MARKVKVSIQLAAILQNISHYIQLEYDGAMHFAEVFYFLHLQVSPTEKKAVAIVSLFSSHHRELFELSHKTLHSCQDHGDRAIVVVDLKTIKAVVSMILHYPILPGAEAGNEPHLRWFLVEKL
jgi:hypothetical protein